MRIKFILVITLFCLGFFMLHDAEAEILPADVKVDRVFQDGVKVQIRATETEADGSRTPNGFILKLFDIENEKQNAMLAIILSADSQDKRVRIFFNNNFTPARIVSIGIINQ